MEVSIEIRAKGRRENEHCSTAVNFDFAQSRIIRRRRDGIDREEHRRSGERREGDGDVATGIRESGNGNRSRIGVVESERSSGDLIEKIRSIEEDDAIDGERLGPGEENRCSSSTAIRDPLRSKVASPILLVSRCRTVDRS